MSEVLLSLSNPWFLIPLALIVILGGWFLIPPFRKQIPRVLWRLGFLVLGFGIFLLSPENQKILTTSTGGIVLAALGVLVSTILLVFAFKLGIWYTKKLNDHIASLQGTKIKALQLQQAQLLSATQLVQVFQFALRWFRNLILGLLVVIYLSGIFILIPATRDSVLGLVHSLLHSLHSLLKGFVDYSPNLLSLAVILAVTWALLKVIKFLFVELGKGTIRLPHFFPEWAKPTFQLVRLLVLAMALVMAFPLLPGASSPAFQGISVFVGVLISLGSSSVVSNALAGLILTYTRAFELGDRIQVGDTLGDVLEKGVLVTRLRTIKNVEVSIPNGSLLSGQIQNFSAKSKQHPILLHTSVTLGYDIPWRKIHQALMEAARRTPGLLSEPAPFVLQTALNDFYVAYELNAATNQPKQSAQLYSLLHQNIQDSCQEAGIEILSPHYQAYRDGNASTIPEKESST